VGARRLFREGFDHTLTEQLERERMDFATCADTPEFRAAIDAFFRARAAKAR
jgi:hypothetical protein